MRHEAPKNYLATIDAFVAHWEQVNPALPAPLILSGNYQLSDLKADRATLVSQMADVEAKVNGQEGGIFTRDQLEAELRERVRQFIALVKAAFPNTPYVRLVPGLPKQGSAPARWMQTLAEMTNAWTQINAMSPIPVGAPVPLILPVGYPLAQFTADRAKLEAAYTSLRNARFGVTEAIGQRDETWQRVRQRLLSFRLAVQGSFRPDHPLFRSLPAFTPPVVPAPADLTISGEWDPTRFRAVISYAECKHPKLVRYELRGCAGGKRYEGAREVVLESHAAGDLTPFLTSFGLEAPGDTAHFKVFLVVRSRRPKGSNAVSVIRG